MANVWSTSNMPLVRSTVSESMQRAAEAQAAMYGSLGRALGGAASTYFEKKDEDKQIDAITQDKRILEMVYRGQTDWPADPKEIRKDVKALYRGMGGRKGIEQLLRLDSAEQRAAQAQQLAVTADERADEKWDAQRTIYDQQLKDREAKLDVYKVAFKAGEPVERITREDRGTVGEVAESYLGGTLGMPQKPFEVSKALGDVQALEREADIYRELPTSHQETVDKAIEKELAKGSLTPDAVVERWRSSRRFGESDSAMDAMEPLVREYVDEQLGIAPTPPTPAGDPWLSEMIGKAGKAIGDIRLPEKVTRETLQVPAPFEARTQEAFMERMQDTGLPDEAMPAIWELAKSKPSMREIGARGIGDFLLRKTFFSKADAAQAYVEVASDFDLPYTDAGKEAFLKNARIADPVDIKKDAMLEFKQLGLDKQYARVSKLTEVKELFELARTNPAATTAAATGLARLFEPSGMLTDEDISRYVQGDASIIANVNRWMVKAKEGKMPEKDIIDLLKVLDTLGNAAILELRNKTPEVAQSVAKRHRVTVDDVYHYTPLGRMIPEPGAGTPPGKKMDAQQAIETDVGGTINTPDGKGKIIKKDAGRGTIGVMLDDGTMYWIDLTEEEAEQLRELEKAPPVSTGTRSTPGSSSSSFLGTTGTDLGMKALTYFAQ